MSLDDFSAFLERTRTEHGYGQAHAPVIRNVSLDGLDLFNELLDDLTFVDSSLRATNLSDQNFARTTITGCDLSGAAVRCSGFYKADLDRCILDGADFSGSDFTRCHTFKSSLRGTVFRQAWLGGASFHESDFTGAQLDDCVLVQTILRECTIDGLTCRNLRGSIIPVSPTSSEVRIGGRDLSFPEFLQVLNACEGSVITSFALGDAASEEAASALWKEREVFVQAARVAQNLPPEPV